MPDHRFETDDTTVELVRTRTRMRYIELHMCIYYLDTFYHWRREHFRSNTLDRLFDQQDIIDFL